MSKLLNIFMLLLVLALICPASIPVQASTGSDSAMLQFTGGGHILGFDKDGVYAAAGDHALKVGFVNGKSVQPVAESAGSSQGTTAPLDKVTYKNAWEGIDIEYTSLEGGIAESTYYLNTPASVDSIRLRYNRPLSLDGQGNLVISFENGTMVESVPVAWQVIDDKKACVQANYIIYDNQEVGFALAGCRPDLAVTIDPTLSWNTFLGSDQSDVGHSVVVDAAGNIFVAGESNASWGNPLRAYSSGTDTFVARLNSSGVLQWNTFLGGAGNDDNHGIALDHNGNIYVVGTSNQSWGSPITGFQGDYDAFLAKLNSSGTIIWSTFVGGSNWDFGQGITADAVGNVYITGYSFATWGSPVRGFSTGAPPDAFAARLTANGVLIWNTFLGGTGSDFAQGITTDPALNVYVAGYSNATWGSPVRSFTPSGFWEDGFSVKLNSSGILQWNTFLGDSGRDYCFRIAADTAGNSYITGQSNAAWGNPVRAYSSNGDGFAVKLDTGGNLIWGTFLGGNGDDSGNSIAVNSVNVYVSGVSDASWGSPVRGYSANRDGFAVKLDAGGNLIWDTFIGGDGDDVGNGVAVDAGSNVYVCGLSDAGWGSPVRAFVPGTTTGPEPHPTTDAFVAKILGNAPSITSFTPTSGDSRTVVTITGNNFLGATIVSFGNVPASLFHVDSNTQITATVGTNATGKVRVTTPAGTAVSKLNWDLALVNTPRGSSMSGGTSAPPQGPVSLPTVSVRSASISASQVAPGAPVTVTADVVNTGTVNGSTSIKVYVNGELENSQGVSVNSGSSTPVTFTISRNEPGTYSVYVGGASAGSFTVDQFADPNIILYISGAMLFFAFIIGILFIMRRRQV